jgi:hypothetical protein
MGQSVELLGDLVRASELEHSQLWGHIDELLSVNSVGIEKVNFFSRKPAFDEESHKLLSHNRNSLVWLHYDFVAHHESADHLEYRDF